VRGEGGNRNRQGRRICPEREMSLATNQRIGRALYEELDLLPSKKGETSGWG